MSVKKEKAKDPLMIKFGERLREIRKQKGLTGEGFGLISGLTKPAISRFENGRANPSLKQIEKICLALDVSIEAFFKGFK